MNLLVKLIKNTYFNYLFKYLIRQNFLNSNIMEIICNWYKCKIICNWYKCCILGLFSLKIASHENRFFRFFRFRFRFKNRFFRFFSVRFGFRFSKPKPNRKTDFFRFPVTVQRSQRFCSVTVSVPSQSRHHPVPRRSKSFNVVNRPKAYLTFLKSP